MNATMMNEITDARANDVVFQSAIADAKNGIVPTGVALAVTGTADGGEQAIYREGDEAVCYKITANGDRTVTRRTPITGPVASQLCAAFLARNNA